MAHDQFSIPYSPEHTPEYSVTQEVSSASAQPLLEALRIADMAQYTPETQPEVFQYLKDIETRIDSYRETAIAADTKRIMLPGTLRYLIDGTVGRSKSPLEKLIDKEATIGGGIFKKPAGVMSQRFWYQGQHNGKGEWYYESKDAQKREVVLHFQTTAATVEKLVKGVPTPFAEGEADIIMLAPQLYEKAVLDQLYPIDAALQDASSAA